MTKALQLFCILWIPVDNKSCFTLVDSVDGDARNYYFLPLDSPPLPRWS